ncbi:MAG: hypothetical protein H6834_12135 [Planctomycetes bacterium]|nr:hypothetical protein [Planctomycetota bacterium]
MTQRRAARDARTEPPLEREELDRRLARARGNAFFVPSHLLRRVLREHHHLPEWSLTLPHHKSCVLETDRLRTILSPRELPELDRHADRRTLLLLRPSRTTLSLTPASDVLIDAWRLLFHARIHELLEARRDLTTEAIQPVIEELGETAYAEALSVLKTEHYLADDEDAHACHVELVAVFLELAYFEKTLLASTFPAFHDVDRVRALLSRPWLDPDATFEETRLEGAPPPNPLTETTSEEPQANYRRLVLEADDRQREGNLVRAAILRTRAARVAAAHQEIPTRNRAILALDRLAQGLGRELALPDLDVERWCRTLPVLLDKADQGLWPQEARFLYDLQRALDDARREIFAVHLGGLTKRHSFRKALPFKREILIYQHLLRARRRLPSLRLHETDRRGLAQCLGDAIAHWETELRDRVRPRLNEAMEASGLTPSSRPARVAQTKVVEELLDLILKRGFLTFHELRDTLSRNQFKFPDVERLTQAFRRDALLQLDRKLERSLAGIYRHGELYRSLLHRPGMLLSGTPFGRWSVLNVLLPFGLAAAILTALQHILGFFIGWLGGADAPHPHLLTPYWVLPFGVFLLFFLRSPRFRKAISRALRRTIEPVRQLLWVLPRRIRRWPPVRRFLRHPWTVHVTKVLWRPFRAATLLWLLLALLDHPFVRSVVHTVTLFVAIYVVFNTHQWASVREALGQGLVSTWRVFKTYVLRTVWRIALTFFRRARELFESMLYSVDQWLRFRSGDPVLYHALKLAILPVWTPIAYLLRLLYDTSFEPRFNPVKYVSVVFAADKIFIPLTPPLLIFFTEMFHPLGPVGSNSLAWFLLYAIPAAVGFLVWELKENWKLYRANRKPVMREQIVTSRGETLASLLHPNWHATTLPELYGRWRRAEREAQKRADWTASRKQRMALESLHGALQRYVEREFLSLLQQSRAFDVPLHVDAVHSGLSTLRIVFASPVGPREHVKLRLEVEMREPWLLADLTDEGLLARLSKPALDTFHLAWIGLYKMLGVNLLIDRLEALLDGVTRRSLSHRTDEHGIWVWPKGQHSRAVYYDLRARTITRPRTTGATSLSWPDLATPEIAFDDSPLLWSEWEDAWDQEQAGEPITLLDRLAVLPTVRPMPPSQQVSNRVLH